MLNLRQSVAMAGIRLRTDCQLRRAVPHEFLSRRWCTTPAVHAGLPPERRRQDCV